MTRVLKLCPDILFKMCPRLKSNYFCGTKVFGNKLSHKIHHKRIRNYKISSNVYSLFVFFAFQKMRGRLAGAFIMVRWDTFDICVRSKKRQLVSLRCEICDITWAQLAEEYWLLGILETFVIATEYI